jgi:uncharacterized protein YraI
MEASGMKVQWRIPAAAAQRRARTVAAVGAAVAVGTTGLMVLAVGTAAADEPGRCNETVNVRAEPDRTAPIVGVCPAGTAVQIAEIREGYLYLTDYAGWAAWEYLTIGGEPTDPSTDPSTTEPAATDPIDPAPVDQELVGQELVGQELVGPEPVDRVPAPTTEQTSTGTTVVRPGYSTVWDASGEDTSHSAGAPSMTPAADPTPGDS